MKIAYIVTTFPSRTEQFVLREMVCLRRMGFEIHVLAAVQGVEAGKERFGGPREYRPGRLTWAAVSALGYFLRKYPWGVGRIFYLALQVGRVCPREAARLLANLHTAVFFTRYLDRAGITHVHGCFLSWPGSMALALAEATGRSFSLAGHARDLLVEAGALELKVRRARFVVTCTKAGARHLRGRLPGELHSRVHLMYHGLSAEELGTGEGQTSERRARALVMAAGRLVEKKDFACLLRALAAVRKRKVEAMLLVVGDGPGRKELEVLAKRLDVTAAVRFLGWQTQEQVREYLRAATILVAPARVGQDGDEEGIPNVILEAFACGAAVVASEAGGIGEAVRHGETGWLVKSRDSCSLAEAIITLLGDTFLRERLTRRAAAWVGAKFSAEDNVRVLAGLFEGAGG